MPAPQISVLLERSKSKLLAGGLLLSEAWLIGHYFHSPVLVGFLLLGGVGFLGDCLLRGNRTVSDQQLKWVLLAWNMVAVLSMYWVWREGIFVVAR